MENKIIPFSIFILFLVSSCSLFKYEVKNYSRNRPTVSIALKLYSNDSFKIIPGSDIPHPYKLEREALFSGEFHKFENNLILIYNKFNLIDTLYSVTWDENVFLMDKFDIIEVANNLNNNRRVMDNSVNVWKDNTEKYSPIIGIPKFPSPFDEYLLKDSIFANVINIYSDSICITINKGLNAGIFWGCKLTDGEIYYTTNEVFADSSVLMPSYLFDLIELNRKYGVEFISKTEIDEIKITKRKEVKPKHLYIKGAYNQLQN